MTQKEPKISLFFTISLSHGGTMAQKISETMAHEGEMISIAA